MHPLRSGLYPCGQCRQSDISSSISTGAKEAAKAFIGKLLLLTPLHMPMVKDEGTVFDTHNCTLVAANPTLQSHGHGKDLTHHLGQLYQPDGSP